MQVDLSRSNPRLAKPIAARITTWIVVAGLLTLSIAGTAQTQQIDSAAALPNGWLIKPSFHSVCSLPLSLKSTEPLASHLDFIGNCASFDHNPARINPIAQILDDAIAKSPLACSSEVPDYSNTRLSVAQSTDVVYSVDSHGVVEKIKDGQRLCGKLSDDKLRHLGFVTSWIVRTGAPYRPGGLPVPGYVNVCFIPFSVSETMIAMTPRQFRYSAFCFDAAKGDKNLKLTLDTIRSSASYSSNDSYCRSKAVDEENIRLEIILWSGEVFTADRSGNLTAPDDTCGNINQETQDKIDAYLSHVSKQLREPRN